MYAGGEELDGGEEEDEAEDSDENLLTAAVIDEDHLTLATHASPANLYRDGRNSGRGLGCVNPTSGLPLAAKVARWQNLIPSFPWIAPGWRAWGTIQGKEGIKFCSVA